MPAKDRYHDTVIIALEKDGWVVNDEQVAIIVAKRRLWIDLEATQDATNILVEVKGFENMPSPVEYLASAIGKYLLYDAILHELDYLGLLYLAVPIAAYEGILSEEVGQLALQKANVRLIVFDSIRAEIVIWQP